MGSKLELVKGNETYRAELESLIGRLSRRYAALEDIAASDDSRRTLELAEALDRDPVLTKIVDEVGGRQFFARSYLVRALCQDFGRIDWKALNITGTSRTENGRLTWRYTIDADFGETSVSDTPSKKGTADGRP